MPLDCSDIISARSCVSRQRKIPPQLALMAQQRGGKKQEFSKTYPPSRPSPRSKSVAKRVQVVLAVPLVLLSSNIKALSTNNTKADHEELTQTEEYFIPVFEKGTILTSSV